MASVFDCEAVRERKGKLQDDYPQTAIQKVWTCGVRKKDLLFPIVLCATRATCKRERDRRIWTIDMNTTLHVVFAELEARPMASIAQTPTTALLSFICSDFLFSNAACVARARAIPEG